MEERERYIAALAAAGERWSNPDYPPRAEAVEKTLNAANRFTEQAVAFAINQQAFELSAENLRKWTQPYPFSESGVEVVVLNAGNVPFLELQDFAAVLLIGHVYRGVVSSRSPHLFPAFVEDLRNEISDLPAGFSSFDDALKGGAGSVMGSGSDETMAEIAARCSNAGVPKERLLLRGSGFAIAILDGGEGDEDRSGLAEDLLLHGGAGCRSVAIVWAPRDLNPDPYFDALSQFREVFPAHEAADGTLIMPRALLAAANQPHAWGDGFLISKGEPQPQGPGHIRWSEYDSPDDVRRWLEEYRDNIQGIVASPVVFDRIGTDLPRWDFGEAQRPPISWRPDGIDTLAFLSRL